jgi:hypothetical protein
MKFKKGYTHAKKCNKSWTGVADFEFQRKYFFRIQVVDGEMHSIYLGGGTHVGDSATWIRTLPTPRRHAHPDTPLVSPPPPPLVLP